MVEREKLVTMVCGLQDGDPDAAEQLFETFQSDIYYFILKTVNNDHDLAEDLTQDTFVTILEKIGDLQEPAAFVTWSRQIAYSKCTGYFKKRKELLADENEDGYTVFDTLQEENEEFIPDAALQKEDLRSAILGMINDLPEEQRSAILLRYFNEISVKEIAEIQGVSEGTVKSRLNYGRKAIKQSVEEYEKKNDVKLHCVGVIPLLLWLFRYYRISSGLSISSNTASTAFTIAESGSTATIVAAAGTTSVSTAATAATTTSAVAQTAVGIGVKVTNKVLTTKVIAVCMAAIATIGGIAIGVTRLGGSDSTTPSHAETQITDTLPTTLHEGSFVPSVPVTEAPTVRPTEPTTETMICEHDWFFYSSWTTELVYEDRICTICGEYEITYQQEDDGSCAHEWTYSTKIYPEYVYEMRDCGLCGRHENISVSPNPCQHQWHEYTKELENGTVATYKECSLCGLLTRQG